MAEIYNYIIGNHHLNHLAKGDKLALAKRANFFQVLEENLYHKRAPGMTAVD